ncbi:sensor kinase, two-component system [Actinokineospora spheciospongiae]|uniref:histidine kinase n=1 Tax=Actinokineospora spheciospongiae TaxID=909613 RepID=W7IP99_9PSEU|nr:HAMP domain-containing sensor histidine kinase [Actinokineospora spheciospongiae]EWC62218.1 sensor kinase, two-component system [Actinokineospora spheciospongiae]
MGGLRTASLRWRVTVTACAVVGVVLIALGVVVRTVFVGQVERGLDGLVANRAQLGRQLAREGVGPAALVRRVDAHGVRVGLTLASGESFGEVGGPPEPGVRRVRISLAEPGRLDGAVLVLSVDTALVDGATSALDRVLLIGGAAALLAAVSALLWGMRAALAPLDAMTRLARATAAGGRGARLAPTHPDTELGRTARAFNEMLDSLEGAEDRLRRFVSDAAHELRTPVAGVQAAVEAVLDPDVDPETRDRLHLHLIRESRRAARLVDDLLHLARLDAGIDLDPSPVDLLDLAHAHADRVRLVAPEVRVVVSGTPTTVVADAERLTQVLTNLTDNARKAMGGRGTLTLAVTAADGHALLDVRDTGPGIAQENRERVFDRLVRFSGGAGAGLGLPIARGLARAHGGELFCLPAEGGAFRLVLPG